MSPASSPARRLAGCVVALLLAGAGHRACAADAAADATRAAFLTAYASAVDTEAADPPALRAYLLYPYVQAARLSRALRDAGPAVPPGLDDRIAAFVAAQEPQPVAQALRRSWLASLAERAQWERFLVHHRDAIDGPALRCHAYAARIGLQRLDGLAVEITKAWLTPRSLPACDRAFTWLRTGGGLDDTLVEQRVRLALEAGNAGFARQVAAPLPPERAAPLLQWAALLEEPRRRIDALIASPQSAVDTTALLAGWARLARSDRAAAKQRFGLLVRARGLDERAASRFALALALPLSWDRDPAALDFFARVDAADFDDTAREWQARAALWAGDWAQASRAIAALSEANRGSARWRYWSARVASQAGDEAAARTLYESLLREDNYYAAMAAARLQRAVAPNPQPLPVDPAQLARIEQLPAFGRARELRLAGLQSEAVAEWRFGHDSLRPEARAQAIHVAARWGWYDQAVATATGERVFNDYALLYPRPYDAQVKAAATLTGLAQETIYGVIRQESLYRRDAVSTADARGLMQLLPETARRTARHWRLPTPTAVSLFDPDVNVVLGAGQLRMLLDRFDGQLPLALAGYNAGPGAAQRWLPARTTEPDVWIENIPYNETRSYVQRILWHGLVFAWLRGGEPQSTRGWLEPVRPPAQPVRGDGSAPGR
jgi:soluble lytic murein transglycosylase